MKQAKQASKVGPFTSARYSADIAAEVIDGRSNPPKDISRTDYALYCIARSLADMARAMDKQAAKGGE